MPQIIIGNWWIAKMAVQSSSELQYFIDVNKVYWCQVTYTDSMCLLVCMFNLMLCFGHWHLRADIKGI